MFISPSQQPWREISFISVSEKSPKQLESNDWGPVGEVARLDGNEARERGRERPAPAT